MNAKALEVIEKCFQMQDDYLNLNDINLTDEDFSDSGPLKKALDKCSHIKQLNLSENKITNIKAFENLLQLQNLYLRKNQISKITGLENFSKLRYLDIGGNQIITVKGLENLSQLQHLYLDNNQIININGLQDLQQLKNLNLNNNQITRIKNGLETLLQLQNLDLLNNQILRINGLGTLSGLRQLNLSNNKITSITGLESLTELQILNLGNNQISFISGLENLSQLMELNLNSNEITTIRNLENLLELRKLNLDKNQITIISGLESLSQLQILNLFSNKITDLRPLIPFLDKNTGLNITYKDSHITFSGGINIGNNPLVSPAAEIVKQGNKAVLNYFKAIDDQGTDYLYEAKMLILGQPRAGKTSLLYKLFSAHAELPTEDKTTRGIDIQRLDFDITDKEGNPRKFYYNAWDFGGQHIYQTTHQFFLTHRSLYILVMDTGKDSTGNDDTTINYWLQAVELLGGNSPLLLVRNEKNGRKVTIDLPQKRARFNFLINDFAIDLDALIPGTPTFSDKRLSDFNHLKDRIEYELKHLSLVGFAMPKNWVQIRNELQKLSINIHYITKTDFIELCKKHEVTEYDRQMELSRIFHDLGIFLHFQDYGALDDFIILQNTWATDAVFAVLDNEEVQNNEGRFIDTDIVEIWKGKGYEPAIHKKLLALMMQFELCYMVSHSKPSTYIIPEMLADSAPDGVQWHANDDLPLQYRYDFMPKGILTRLIVRMHKHIARHNNRQVVWKTGVKIDGINLDCPNTFVEITEAWDNKQLNLRVQGPFSRELMSKVTYEVDALNDEYFRQVENSEQSQKSRWYKMIPCICVTCMDSIDKHFFEYRQLLEMKEFGMKALRCDKRPYTEVNISALIDGVFAKEEKKKRVKLRQTIKIFLASSSELKEEREQFEIFISRENKRLSEQGIFLRLEIWEDFLDAVSQTSLQDEYNQVIEGCDIFVMLFFTKVGKYTSEEFERAFKQFNSTDKPKIFTYFKSANIKSTNINGDDTISLLNFRDKLKELKHFYTAFTSNEALHLHFKKQLERLYDL